MEKNRYMFCACLGVVEGFSLDGSLYKDLKKPMLPNQQMFKQKVMQRVPDSQVRQLKNNKLIALLQIEEYKVMDKADCQCITASENDCRSLLLGKEECQKKTCCSKRSEHHMYI